MSRPWSSDGYLPTKAMRDGTWSSMCPPPPRIASSSSGTPTPVPQRPVQTRTRRSHMSSNRDLVVPACPASLLRIAEISKVTPPPPTTYRAVGVRDPTQKRSAVAVRRHGTQFLPRRFVPPPPTAEAQRDHLLRHATPGIALPYRRLSSRRVRQGRPGLQALEGGLPACAWSRVRVIPWLISGNPWPLP